METNEIDDILNGLGMNTTPSTPTETSPTESSDTFSDIDIDNILEDNGFQGEGSEEEEENESYNENRGEGNDITVEQEESSESEGNDSLEAITEEQPETIDTSSIEETKEEAKVPLNSPTLLIDESTSRFSGAEWFNEIQKQRIIVAGCGGIGSNLIFQLARMVPANITIYDNDNVELVNMAGQLYSYSDIGKAKVDAIADMISNYTSTRQVNAVRERFTEFTEAGDIMMSGFDNMRARKTFFESWYNHISKKSMEERAKCLLLDGRLSMNELQIFCIRGDDEYNINRYQSEFLFRDFYAEDTICSMKQTTYLACMIGSLMVNLFTNFVASQLNPIMPYDLPFFTEYDAQNMLFKTEN